MLCVIAKVDDLARERLRALCSIAEEFHYPARHLHGHITLVSYIGPNETEFIRQCKALLSGREAFTVAYHGVGLLPPTPSIVASPTRTQELETLHDALLSAAPSEMDSWSSRELWHPHTTLFFHSEADLRAISERMQQRFLPFSATISKIEFSRVTDRGYEVIDSFDLKPRQAG